MISISFYNRQIVFFLAVFAAVFGIAWAINQQTSLAAGRPLVIPSGQDEFHVELSLQDRGRVTIDGTEIAGVVDFLRDRDEFGYLLLDQPDTPLKKVEAIISFPRPVTTTEVAARAIIIHNASTNFQTRWLDDQHLLFDISDIEAGATVTLAASLPKGAIQPSLTQRLFGTIRTAPKIIWLSFAFVLPIATLIVLFMVLSSQRRKGVSRVDDECPTPPDGLEPAVVVALVDGRVSARAIAATLLDLARRKFVDIGSDQGRYIFTKRRQLLSDYNEEPLAPFEQALIDKVFAPGSHQIRQDDLQVRIGSTLFSKKVADVYLGIYQTATARGYFTEDPVAVAGTYRLVGLLMFFLSLAGFLFGAVFFSDPPTPLLFWLGMLFAALVVIHLAPLMPAYTSRGLRDRSRWLAFKNYLMSTEPLDFQSQNQQVFTHYLPYAIALGVEVEWARRFMKTSFQLPEWYTSKERILRLEDFVNDLLPMIGYLAHELAAAKEPTLS